MMEALVKAGAKVAGGSVAGTDDVSGEADTVTEMKGVAVFG